MIWDLFGLCPTPAAALAADVGAIQALVQPLGLFRKRALAIQQLSHDYLYKQASVSGGCMGGACLGGLLVARALQLVA